MGFLRLTFFSPVPNTVFYLLAFSLLFGKERRDLGKIFISFADPERGESVLLKVYMTNSLLLHVL